MTGSDPAKHLLIGRGTKPSPQKKRSKKQRQPVNSSIQSSQREALQRRFDAILKPQPPPSSSSSTIPILETSLPPPGFNPPDAAEDSMAMDTEPMESYMEPCNGPLFLRQAGRNNEKGEHGELINTQNQQSL
ncbi:hypothetical protein PQX77_015810 [Marasmius sp. AFHP31]|nr:hypothetical protein PQX77_015810 [Marasmius sp. AFHP31]